jgi:hypothetical protein
MRQFPRTYSRNISALVGGLALALVACKDEPRRGVAGDTCSRTDDCSTGLACVAEVCVAKAGGEEDAGRSDADGGTSMSPLPSGASCSARRDCAAGLTCVDNVCGSTGMGTEVPTSTRGGGRGETCQAKNDCAGELMCVMQVCRDVEVNLERLPKSCYRIECTTKEDCCQSFVPNPNCETYRMNCETDPIFCNTYRSLCECTQECEEELCVAASPGCVNDAECTSSQTPFCVASKCRQCNDNSACTGAGTQCVEGVCIAACTRDENCPALHRCEKGACIESGCQTDRECVFLIKDGQAVCSEGKCRVPCANDSDCAAGMMDPTMQSFQVCEAGECIFVGCDNDAECRALFNLEGQPGNVRAVCREETPDAAD